MTKILTLAAIVAIGVGLGFAGPAAAQQKTIKLGTEGAYKPFNYIDASGKVQGFDIEIGNALCAKMNAKCEWVTQDWDGIIPALLVKKFDAIIASMSITEERKKSVDFTERYYFTPAQFIAKKGVTFTATPEGLKGKTVGVQRATIHENYLEQKLKGVVTVKHYDTQENANLDLAAGRLDAVLADSTVLLDFLNSPEGKDFANLGAPIVDPSIFGVGAGIAVRKGDNDLREAFNRALKEITDDGTYKKINDKYFPFSIR